MLRTQYVKNKICLKKGLKTKYVPLATNATNDKKWKYKQNMYKNKKLQKKFLISKK